MENYDKMKTLISNVGMQNKFEFSILGFPSFVDSNSVVANIPIYARSTTIPSMTTEVTKARYGNIERSFNSDVQVDNVICSFFDLREMKIHSFFKQWQLLSVYSDEFGSRVYYPADYQSTININVNDEVTWEMTRCYPVSVGDFQLSYDTEDALGAFDVTFNVHRLYTK